MPNILKKLRWGRAIGVYFGGDRVSITDVSNTVKGPVTLNQQEFKIADEEPVQALTNILREYAKEHKGENVPLCLGPKPERTFFMTSVTRHEEPEQIQDELLEHAGFRKPEERNSIIFDYFKVNKIKSSAGWIWGIGICKKRFVSELYSAVSQAGFKNILFKPTPWAMSSFSVKLPQKSKNWKVFIHIFLGETEGLAVLMVKKNPVYWKKFSILPETPLVNVEVAIKGISMQSAVTLSLPVIDGIILQGPNAEKLSSKLYENLNIEVAIADGAGYTDLQCSYGLAMSVMSGGRELFDLFRHLRPAPGIMQMFPWKLAAMILFMAGCMAFMMWQKASGLARSYNMITQQGSSHTWALDKQTADIAKERKELIAENGAVSKFLSSRVVWSNYLRDLPTRLPANVILSKLAAECTYKGSDKEKEGGKGGGKRSLSLVGTTSFDKDKATSGEIEALMDSLGKAELLQRDFPRIELAEIKWRSQAGREIATFTVLAMPKK